MSKFTINHSCGHVETVNLIGPHRARDSRAAWLADHPCSACAREIKRTEGLEAAKEATADLPDLTGTPKQVDWATKLRAETKADADRLYSLFAQKTAGREPNATEQASIDNFRAAIARVYAQPATWWIDNRELARHAPAMIQCLPCAK